MLLAALLLADSCSKEELQEIRIDDKLAEYFEAFAAEGALRGIQIDFREAQVEGLIDQLDNKVSGQCQHDADAPDRVVIDPDYWERATHMQREFIVFHELGHCVLDRTHLDSKSQDGTCRSMMHSSAGTCRNAYSIATRTEYLDELFSK